jgi:hypothetical protein
MTRSADEGKGLARALPMARRHGLWMFAALAALPSYNFIALLTSAEAAKNASRLTPGDILLAALAVCAAIEVLRFRRPWKRAVVPAAAFVWVAAAATAAIVASLTQDEFAVGGAAKEVVQLIEILIVACGWARWAPEGRRDLDRALYALAGAVTANVLLALIQLAYVEHVFHVRGLFGHRNTLGMFLAVTLPLLAAGALAPGRHWGVRLWLLVTAALGLCVTTNAGLFAAVALGIVTATVVVGLRVSGEAKLPQFSYGLVAAAGIIIIALFVQPVLMPRVRESQFRSVDILPEDAHGRRHVSMRARRWGAALDCVRANAALGVGPGQFQKRIGGFYSRFFEKPAGRGDDVPGYDIRFDEPGSQSLYVVTAVEMGLLGLVAVGFFLASAVGRAAASSARDASGFAAGALGLALAVTVACLFSSVMVRGVALVFVLVLALGERAADSAGDDEAGAAS